VHVFPAVVPEGEFSRAEVVPVRLARKVGPLFGVRWEHEPFGRTWVCDFASLTLGEIARGAPMPSKDEQARLDASQPRPVGAGATDSWQFVGRGVWTPGRSVVSATLANATLNKFGPDTKAAVVLTGANRLLVDATAAVGAVCRHLVRREMEPATALAVWAGLTLEVFRGQPALVVAAIQARAVQRSLTTRWGSQVAIGGLGMSAARCEIGASGADDGVDAWRPVRFALVDDTLDLLLEGVGVDQREDVAGAWCRRLLHMGRPGSGLVWLSESDDGHRAAYFYQRVGAMVAPFVEEALDVGNSARGDDPGLPGWPANDELAHLSVMAARAHVVAAHVADSYLRYARGEGGTRTVRRRRRAHLVAAVEAAADRLGRDDPAVLLLSGYQEYMHLRDAVREPAPDPVHLAELARVVIAGQQRTSEAFRKGLIDPGAASYLLEVGNIALLDARTHLIDQSSVDRHLARTWPESLAVRGLEPDPWAHLDELNDSQIFHLGYYAEFLSKKSSTTDIRRSLQIFTAVAVVRDKAVANEPASLLAKHRAGGRMHLMCAETAAELAQRTPQRERSNVTRIWEEAVEHTRAALANPALSLLFSGEESGLAGEALRCIEPTLRHLLEAGEPAEGFDWDAATRLTDAAVARLENSRIRVGDKARIRDLKTLRDQLTAASANSLPA
jgi:hypothetical protein